MITNDDDSYEKEEFELEEFIEVHGASPSPNRSKLRGTPYRSKPSLVINKEEINKQQPSFIEASNYDDHPFKSGK